MLQKINMTAFSVGEANGFLLFSRHPLRSIPEHRRSYWKLRTLITLLQPERNGGSPLIWNDCLYETLLLLGFPISAWFQLFLTHRTAVWFPRSSWHFKHHVLEITLWFFTTSKVNSHSMPDVTHYNEFHVHCSHAWYICLSMINARPLLARLIFFIQWFLSWKIAVSGFFL